MQREIFVRGIVPFLCAAVFVQVSVAGPQVCHSGGGPTICVQFDTHPVAPEEDWDFRFDNLSNPPQADFHFAFTFVSGLPSAEFLRGEDVQGTPYE